MARKKKKVPTKIDPNELKTRNLLMVALINGVTKSGVQPDEKKEADKQKCRQPIEEE